MLSGRFLSYSKRRKIDRNDKLLSFVITRCHSLHHSLSFVLPLVVTKCSTRCHLMYYSLTLDVTLLCLFKSDQFKRSLNCLSFSNDTLHVLFRLLSIFRGSHRRCSVRKVFLEISQIHRKTPVLESHSSSQSLLETDLAPLHRVYQTSLQIVFVIDKSCWGCPVSWRILLKDVL